MKNTDSLDTLCAAFSYGMGIPAPRQAAKANERLCAYLDSLWQGKKADRLFLYNPDAVAQWLFEKYSDTFAPLKTPFGLELPLCTVMPSVTPVCFGTMYTGAQPEVHGIRAYVKPVITVDSFFDTLLRNGKKPAIVSTAGDSMSKIYLERDMDYYIFDTLEEVNAKADELIREDEHDVIVVYNGNYDATMHRFGPESGEALRELQANVTAYKHFYETVRRHWRHHNTLMGFATDHGCHAIDGNCGSHGLDMEEDLNIVHWYEGFLAQA